MSDKPDYLNLVTALAYDEDGRITGHKTQAIGFTEQEIAAGARLLIAEGDWGDTGYRAGRYVDLSGDAPVIAERPEFEGRFDRPILPAGGETRLPGAPAGTVRFTGPVSGTHEHEGGDLEIGFTVPGTYTISFEAFPALPVALTLTVTD